ncbi:Peptidase S28 [Sesbania bispinosa]|nr:Peptidase S28 [Sesbania bispinosa]
MEHQPLSCKCLLFIFLIYSSTYLTSTNSVRIPRLSPIAKWERTLHVPVSYDTEDIKTFYYEQVLDHFNYKPESYNTFQQRYMINFKYWGGANCSAPILVYLGAEEGIDEYPNIVGFLPDNAATFNALLVYIEHRYYGKSIPFGSLEEAFKNASTLGYFNSAQALADYAEVIIDIKRTLNAQNSPVIVVGGSYGGMLASWFRLKYPHLTIGALASSAPILYFDDITPPNAYYSEASETCYETILKSWSEIDRVASQPNGLSILSQRFNTCYPLRRSVALKYYLEDIYAIAAQYNSPPAYPVSMVCGGIDGASFGSDILSRIYAGVVAFNGNTKCTVNGGGPANESETFDGWSWQTCSELFVPMGKGNDSMFEPDPFNFDNYAKECKEQYGVSPRPHWITTYYGGHNIKLVLERFGSNIIFSNGLKDPFSIGGVLDDISDSIVAIHTVNGSHCLDILPANLSDPTWLVEQRKKEVGIIKGWITQYYTDLHALKGTPKFLSK